MSGLSKGRSTGFCSARGQLQGTDLPSPVRQVHRARVRTDYLHRLQRAYEAEARRLEALIESDVSPREKTAARKNREKLLKQMQECLAYDQVIAHVANQRIKIDLDDGVKVNYAKFQGVEVPQGDGRKPLKADLLAKI